MILMKHVRQRILIFLPFILGMIISCLLAFLFGHLVRKFNLVYPDWIGMIMVLIGLIPLAIGGFITADKLNNSKK